MPDPYQRHDLISDDPDRPQRVSALAVSSLVFGILCCIPGLGLIALILGAAGLIQIRDPEKRLAGKTLAIIGMVLGALGVVTWIAIMIGTLIAMNSLRVYGSVIQDLETPARYAQVRGMLTAPTNKAVSDDRLKDVAAEIQADWGHYAGMPKGLGEWINGYTSHHEFLNRALAAAGVAAPGGSPIPLPIRFDNGGTIAVFIIDPRAPAGSTGAASIDNFGVVDKTGKMIWLLEPATSRSPPAPTGPAHLPTGASGATGTTAPSEAPAPTSPTGR